MAWSEFNQITNRSKIRLFRPELLARPEIQILLAFRDDKPVGGGIINFRDGVVGIFNLFYLTGEKLLTNVIKRLRYPATVGNFFLAAPTHLIPLYDLLNRRPQNELVPNNPVIQEFHVNKVRVFKP